MTAIPDAVKALAMPDGVDASDPLAMAHEYQQEQRDAEGFTRLCRLNGDWFRHSGACYETAADEFVVADAYNWLASKRDTRSGEVIKPNRARVETFIHALKAAALIDVKTAPAWLEAKAGLPNCERVIAFQNGLLDVDSRRLLALTRRWFGLNARTFDYSAKAPAPVQWLAFLSDLFGDDAESIETLQELFGLMLTSDTSFQKIFMLVGPKRGGKGTIAKVLTQMVGSANVVAPTLNSLGQHFGLESLIAKQVAVISDARLSTRTDASAVTENILRITGEDGVSVPRKHREDFTTKLAVRFLMLTNELPALFDQSGALASRFIVVALTKSFYGREDRGLEGRLLTELPGITNWSLDGLTRLYARGHFRQPRAATELVAQLEALSSPLKAFVADRCEVAPGASVSCDALFLAWSAWAIEQGRHEAGTKQIFGRNLAAVVPGLRISQPRVNGAQLRHYEGIRLSEAR